MINTDIILNLTDVQGNKKYDKVLFNSTHYNVDKVGILVQLIWSKRPHWIIASGQSIFGITKEYAHFWEINSIFIGWNFIVLKPTDITNMKCKYC